MLKKLAVALIATSFLAAPALARSGVSQPATASHPAGKSLVKPVSTKHVKHHKRHKSHMAMRGHKAKVVRHGGKTKHSARTAMAKQTVRPY